MKDMQDEKPEVKEKLTKVGVTDLRTIIQTKWRGRLYRFVPSIEITVDLSEGKKGAHMSRLIESITEALEEETLQTHESIEELEKHILEKLAIRHPYGRAEIKMKTELVVEKKTPQTRKKTMEAHDITVTTLKEDGVYGKILRVDVVGNTVCPHAMEKNDGRSHIQRALGTLEIETAHENPIGLEEMIDCVEESFSSPVYTLLKSEDESHVVDKLYSNPKFVEDVARGILSNAKQRFSKSRIRVKVVSYESIHRHNVIAEASAQTK